MRAARLAVGTAALAGVTLLGAPSALAACDAYSGACTEVLPTTLEAPPAQQPAAQQSGQQPAGVGSSTSARPSSLPFTGGESLLLAALGAGAVAGGVALVAAGRRRATA